MMRRKRIFWAWLIISILILLCLTNCKTPAQKLERFHKRYPELFLNKTDSIKQDVYFTVNGVELKRKFELGELDKSPLYFKEKQLSVMLKKDTVTNFIYLEAKCDTVRDTIPVYIKYPVYNYVEKGFLDQFQPWHLWLFLILVLIAIVLRFIFKK